MPTKWVKRQGDKWVVVDENGKVLSEEPTSGSRTPRSRTPRKSVWWQRGIWAKPATRIVVVLLIVVLLLAKCLADTNGSFSASVDSFVPLNNHQILVDVYVTNTGGSAGSASCSVTAFTPDHTNSADELFQTNTLQPGHHVIIQVTATVTGNAAYQVQQSGITASC